MITTGKSHLTASMIVGNALIRKINHTEALQKRNKFLKRRLTHYAEEARRANEQLGKLHQEHIALQKKYDALWDKVNRP
jgi:predicted nuclease with TOPRIM domain